MQRLLFNQSYSLPPDQVYAYLSEHENLGPLFGAKIKRINDGTDGTRNGVGSVRQLKVGPLPPFEETVTEATPGKLIRYRITKDSPLRDHRGEMTFSEDGQGGTTLRYEISFGAVVPGLDAIIAAGLKRNVSKGLAQVPGAR